LFNTRGVQPSVNVIIKCNSGSVLYSNGNILQPVVPGLTLRCGTPAGYQGHLVVLVISASQTHWSGECITKVRWEQVVKRWQWKQHTYAYTGSCNDGNGSFLCTCNCI